MSAASTALFGCMAIGLARADFEAWFERTKIFGPHGWLVAAPDSPLAGRVKELTEWVDLL